MGVNNLTERGVAIASRRLSPSDEYVIRIFMSDENTSKFAILFMLFIHTHASQDSLSSLTPLSPAPPPPRSWLTCRNQRREADWKVGEYVPLGMLTRRGSGGDWRNGPELVVFNILRF